MRRLSPLPMRLQRICSPVPSLAYSIFSQMSIGMSDSRFLKYVRHGDRFRDPRLLFTHDLRYFLRRVKRNTKMEKNLP